MPTAKPDIHTNEPLAPHTTIKLGGPAAHFCECRSIDEIKAALNMADAHNWPVHILGEGSNTIFSDQGFTGLVISIRLTGITWSKDGTIHSAAGEPWDPLVEQAVSRGLAGIECLSGIPGLVGATPMQNVGAYGQDVANVITHVTALDRHTQTLTTFTNEECHFTYRNSRFKDADANRYIITEVTYQLDPAGTPTVSYHQVAEFLGDVAIHQLGHGTSALQTVRHAVLTLRRRKSMVIDPNDANTRSCGSFFVNPIVPASQITALLQHHPDLPQFPASDSDASKIPAAWLIEHAGFPKGHRHHGVGISTNHNLALVNYDGNTAQLLELAEQIQRAVHAKFGIQLEREPIFVPQK